MSYVDSSVLVSIAAAEPDCEEMAELCRKSSRLVTSPVSQIEAALATGRIFDRDYSFGAAQVREVIAGLRIEVLAVPSDIASAVMEAYLSFGKGTGHPAKLNFGDCFSNAMAKRLNIPLFFKGGDFAKTDLGHTTTHG